MSSMRKYLGIAAMAMMAAAMGDDLCYRDAPSGGKTAKSYNKRQQKRRAIAQKNRKANRRNRR